MTRLKMVQMMTDRFNVLKEDNIDTFDAMELLLDDLLMAGMLPPNDNTDIRRRIAYHVAHDECNCDYDPNHFRRWDKEEE